MFAKKYRVQDTMALDECRNSPCVISGTRPRSDCHHVKTRKSGGPDESWNLCPLTRELHTEFHKVGIITFAEKYPKFKEWLITNKWTFDEFRQKWMTP